MFTLLPLWTRRLSLLRLWLEYLLVCSWGINAYWTEFRVFRSKGSIEFGGPTCFERTHVTQVRNACGSACACSSTWYYLVKTNQISTISLVGGGLKFTANYDCCRMATSPTHVFMRNEALHYACAVGQNAVFLAIVESVVRLVSKTKIRRMEKIA